MEKHICGLCGQEFTSTEAYIAHTCTVNGFTPADPRFNGPDFEAISKAALARGEAAKQASV